MELQNLILILAVFGAGSWLFRPLVLALAERLRGGRAAGADTQRQIETLREDLLAELQVTRREMAELGERVDFAERLLARERDASRLPRGDA